MANYKAKITGRGPCSTVPNCPRAVDADVFLGDRCVGEVTLLPHEQTGVLGRWGGLENWACSRLIEYFDSLSDEDEDRGDAIEAVCAAVVAKAALEKHR